MAKGDESKNSERSCLTTDQLHAILEVDQPLDEQWADHLDTCIDCVKRLEALSDSKMLEPYHNVAETEQFQADWFGSDLPIFDEKFASSFGRFQIESVIGSGGMGIVYQGRDSDLGRTVAIKVLKNLGSETALARFEREASAISKLSHPNIVPVYTSGKTADGRPFLVMPLVVGDSLKELLQQPMDARRAARLIASIANGLSAAHQANMVHRDIKPANILIDEKDGQAKLLDFGLVRGIDDNTLTQTEMLCGTPEYMSPEQASHFEKAEARSDIYSLGITLYECLTGSVPFRGRPLDVLNQHREGAPITPSRMNRSIPRDLETICLKAIEKEPSLRYESASNMARDLNSFLEGRAISARPIGHLQKAGRWANRNRTLATMITLLILSLVLGTAVSTSMWSKSESNAAIALRNADDLKVSRLRMRNSVRSFQRRVFTDKSMHWQMPSNMRAEMFSEMIEYLDEFARLDRLDEANSDSPDDITDDYIEIARAALEVGQRKQAKLASGKALSRIRRLNSIQESQAKNIELHFDALHLAFSSLNESEPARRDLAREAVQISKAEQVRYSDDSPPDESNAFAVIWEINSHVAHSMTIIADQKLRDSSPQQLKNRFESLISPIALSSNTEDENVETQLRTELRSLLMANELGWRLIEFLPQPDAVMIAAKNESSIVAIRSRLRSLKMPLSVSEWLRGKTHSALANALANHGDLKEAVQSAVESKNAFQNAINIQPRNLIWRNDQAAIMMQMSDWLVERDDFASAINELTFATKSCVGVIRFDPGNTQMRVQIIKMLVKLADLSERSGRHGKAATEYYVAAQDCRLLLKNESLGQWGYDVRIWLLSKVVKQFPNYDNEGFKAKFFEMESQFIEQLPNDIESDPSEFQLILDGKYKPSRPADLEIERLTGDIVNEMIR